MRIDKCDPKHVVTDLEERNKILEAVPVEDLIEALNNKPKADQLIADLGLSRDMLIDHAEDLAKTLIEGLVVVNRV